MLSNIIRGIVDSNSTCKDFVADSILRSNLKVVVVDKWALITFEYRLFRAVLKRRGLEWWCMNLY